MLKPVEYDLRTGQRLRFPLGSITRPVDSLTNSIYPYDWEIVSFGGPGRPGHPHAHGMVLCRRLADGYTKWVSERIVAEFADASRIRYSEGEARRAKARVIRERREAGIWERETAARTEGWTERPCYYATVLRRETGDHRALDGPFATHAAALLALPGARRAAGDSGDPRAAWYAYGTALLASGSAPVLFPGSGQPFALAA